MISLKVCSLGAIPSYEEFAPRYMISFLDYDVTADMVRPDWVRPACHFPFYFADIDQEGNPEGPTRDDIRALVRLGKRLCGPESEARILVHCRAGVSRSSAAAFILHCIHQGAGEEAGAMERTVASCESRGIWPNSLMARYADAILKRDGRMMHALEEWKNGNWGFRL